MAVNNIFLARTRLQQFVFFINMPLVIAFFATTLLHPSTYDTILPQPIRNTLPFPQLTIIYFLISMFMLPLVALEHERWSICTSQNRPFIFYVNVPSAIAFWAVTMLHPSSYEVVLPEMVYRNLPWPAVSVTYFLLSMFVLPFAALECERRSSLRTEHTRKIRPEPAADSR